MHRTGAIVLTAVLMGTGCATTSPGQEDGSELVIRLQSGLYRVGCLTGEPDGVWGPASKAALSEFARRIDQRLIGLSPSAEALELVDQYDEQVCGRAVAITPDEEPVEVAPEQAELVVVSEADDAVIVAPPEPEPQPAFASGPEILLPPPKPFVSCVVASVTVGPKQGYGDRWDFPKKAPDVDFRELTTSSANYCNDSYSCELRITTTADSLTFQIEDDDQMSNNDLIGSGQCAIGAQCNLAPAASISMTPCS